MVKINLTEVLHLQEQIDLNPSHYEYFVYEKLYTYCPQVSRTRRMERSKSVVQEFKGRLLIHDHYNLSPKPSSF